MKIFASVPALICLVAVGIGCPVRSTTAPTTFEASNYQTGQAVADDEESSRAEGSHSASPADESPSAPKQGNEPSATAGVKPHHFDMTKLRKFYDDKTMTSQQRLEGLLGCLKEEMSNPSFPADFGPGGGPLDSASIQTVMLGIMGQTVAAEDIAKARARATSVALWERLTVALGIAGDKTVTKRLVRILARHHQGFMRRLAAEALAELKQESAKTVLRQALKDPYSRIRITDIGPPPHTSKVYPVREAAARALRALGEDVNPDIYSHGLLAFRGQATRCLP